MMNVYSFGSFIAVQLYCIRSATKLLKIFINIANINFNFYLPAVDPYVVVKCEGESVKSNFCRDTLEPEWQHFKVILYRKKPNAEPITIEVHRKLMDITS